jgi:hypothetical protein
MQARQTALFKPPHPAFDGARILPEDIGNVIAAEALSNQQDAVQPVIIARSFRSQDFLLHC